MINPQSQSCPETVNEINVKSIHSAAKTMRPDPSDLSASQPGSPFSICRSVNPGSHVLTYIYLFFVFSYVRVFGIKDDCKSRNICVSYL